MAQSILIPVDLAHKDALSKAVSVAGDLAKLGDGAKLTLIGVTSSAVTEAAHNPVEFKKNLEAYAREVSQDIGHPVETRSMIDNDVAVDLGNVLIKAAEDMGVDLIVMASHIPGLLEHIFASNAGYVASHAKCSVYVVR
ncbi:universal stress protein [Roseibium porphyridii]|uniref:Universal stress protein n=1 Tax=Roseibium porphyridii TaxID=2866279 RepID=A0ABY8EYT7_9HYPH|nr:universal stress protein [Roseibium sp. KMA01]WFE88169.1 universal stress protein [Roseibium sp. KMA01]